MHSECDELVASPADIANRNASTRTDFLHEMKLLFKTLEPVAGPRKRCETGRPGNVGEIEPDMDETAAMAAVGVHFPDRDAGAFTELAECAPIEPRLRIDVERRSSKRHESRNRRVD